MPDGLIKKNSEKKWIKLGYRSKGFKVIRRKNAKIKSNIHNFTNKTIYALKLFEMINIFRLT